jgi:hypothetical protein
MSDLGRILLRNKKHRGKTSAPLKYKKADG